MLKQSIWDAVPSGLILILIDLQVFPGDMLQFMTNSYLPSTPHKVGLNTRERFAFAYFHEPNFNAVCKRLPEFSERSELGRENGKVDDSEEVHYGKSLTLRIGDEVHVC